MRFQFRLPWRTPETMAVWTSELCSVGQMSQSQITKGRGNDGAPDEALEQQLKELLQACDREGGLPATEAALDVAFAQGYKKGLEEGRADHLEAMRTLLMRALESKFGPIDDDVFERIGEADLSTLEGWLVELVRATSIEAALGA